jgi:hypothetical protein
VGGHAAAFLACLGVTCGVAAAAWYTLVSFQGGFYTGSLFPLVLVRGVSTVGCWGTWVAKLIPFLGTVLHKLLQGIIMTDPTQISPFLNCSV